MSSSQKLVRDVMHRGVVACWTDELLIDVAQRLCENEITAIVVLNESGLAQGVISQTDLAEVFVQEDWQDQTASQIMTPDIAAVTGDTPLDIAIAIMLNRNIHRLLVIAREKQPIGVLSLSDVICEMARRGLDP
jgi:crotonyl-CoA carboxylase/reductase